MSVIYDLRGDGKTSVRASYSYYFATKITLANNLGGLFTQPALTWGANSNNGNCSTAPGCWLDTNLDSKVQVSELIGNPTSSSSRFNEITGIFAPQGNLVDPSAQIGRALVMYAMTNGADIDSVIKSSGFSHPRISPSGDQVAFLEHPVALDDRGAVVVVDRAGRKTTLSSGWASIEGLAWSKDGDEVLFTAAEVGADSALYAVDLSGKRRLVEKAPGRLVLHDVSADGTLLLERNSHRLEMRGLRADGSDVDLSWFDFSGPADLSADGRTLLFYESGEGGGLSYSVYVRPTDGSLPVRLGEGRATSLSPDGKSVIALPLEGDARITILSTGAGQVKTIRHPQIEQYRWAWWLPDGSGILFAATKPKKNVRLYVHDLASGALHAVTPEGRGGFKSTVTPDGKAVITLESGGKETGHRFLLQPLDGGEAAPLPWIQSGDQPLRWSADGKSLYVQRGLGPIQIYRIDAAGKRELIREIAPKDAAGAGNMGGNVVMTADAGTMVYSHHRILSDLYLVDALAN